MSIRRLAIPIVALGLVAAACASAAAPPPTPAPSSRPSGASPAASAPAASAEASPAGTVEARGDEAGAEAEAALLHGSRLDLQGRCLPLRNGLPPGAVGAITCAALGETAAAVTMMLFDTQAQMLAAYASAVADLHIAPRSHDGRCQAVAASEGGYVPGDDHPGVVVNERLACWTDQQGVPHSLVTGPPYLLFRVDGRPGAALSDVGQYAMLGSQDQPGGPTLWAEEPRSPEK